MAEAALRKSRDVGELKKFRAAIKGQVTGALNKLETLFAQKVAEDFDHGRILVTEVNEVESRLKEKLGLFRKLHDRCCELRDVGEDADQEIELSRQDDEYVEEVTSKVYPMFNMIEAYYRSRNIPALERKFEDSFAAFKFSMRNAQQVVQCLNGLNPEEVCEAANVQMQPAEETKDKLRKHYDEVVVASNELKDALKSRGDN